jgi:hypothetical protein
MAPLITLYILAACVAVAGGLFIVMIVLTAVRPSRLPDVPLEPEPPLQRVIRALTPPPVAIATAMPSRPPAAREFVSPPDAPLASARGVVAPAPAVARAVVPRAPVVARAVVAPPVVPQPAAAARAAVAPPIVAPPVVMQPTVVTPPPAARRAEDVSSPPARGIKPSVTLPAHLDAPRRFIPLGPAPAPGIARPAIYPVKRMRMWPRIVLCLFVTTIAAAGVVIAYPHVLDPLCDDYAWFGDEAAVVVRDHAREARAAIVGWLARL